MKLMYNIIYDTLKLSNRRNILDLNAYCLFIIQIDNKYK